MVFGPNMQNFEAIAKAFVQQNGAVQVRDAIELESAVAELLADGTRAAELGSNARRIVRENSGGIERTADMIVEHLEGGEIYIATKRKAN